jgi:MFS family permease
VHFFPCDPPAALLKQARLCQDWAVPDVQTFPVPNIPSYLSQLQQPNLPEKNMSAKSEGIAPNASRLLWAGFMAILAAGVGFAIRGGIFDNWGKEFGFTGAQLGAIGGAGFSGFCFGIILGGVIVDKIGYGKLVALALLCHVVSAFVTFGASTPENAYSFLFWGMFIFAYANGTLEAVANPLVATLYPTKRTHYLNILHASWPAGMVLGSVAGWVLDDKMQLHWKMQLALYLVPTALYAIMFLGQKFPKSEAAEKGASFVQMFKPVGILGALVACYLLSLFFGDIAKAFAPDNAKAIGYAVGGILLIASAIITKFSIGSILLFILFVTHALVGAVELGTDGWIQNITGNLFTSEQGKYLFIWTSAIMFGLRFCAHWIETKLKLSPIGLLLACSVIGCVGLNLASSMQTFGMAMVALGIYAVGKTFFWPTMLAVVGDRYPQTGAVAMSIMGGIGMLSAGLIGGPGLGYGKDRFAGEALQKADAAIYAEYKAETPSTFLNLASTEAYGLDGKKLAAAKEATEKTPAQQLVVEADQQGDRATLKADAYIPLTMAVIYLLLMIYFKAIGGYKIVRMDEQSASA